MLSCLLSRRYFFFSLCFFVFLFLLKTDIWIIFYREENRLPNPVVVFTSSTCILDTTSHSKTTTVPVIITWNTTAKNAVEIRKNIYFCPIKTHEKGTYTLFPIKRFICKLRTLGNVLLLILNIALLSVLQHFRNKMYSTHQTYPEHAKGVLSHGNAILGDLKIIPHVALRGTVWAGEAARSRPKWQLDRGQQSKFAYEAI